MEQQGSPEEFQITVRMTPEQGREFVELLMVDDEFRARFESEPEALLREWGIDLPREALPEKVALPDKDELRQALETLTDEVAVPQPYRPPYTPWVVFIALSRARR